MTTLSLDPPGVHLDPPDSCPLDDEAHRIAGATVSDSEDGNPWSLAAVARRGLLELRDIAAALHQRRRPPIEILIALHQHGRLLAGAHGYRLHGMLPLVRELPGLERWDPDAEAEAVEAEWRRRAQALIDWLRNHKGEALAECVGRAAERIGVAGIGEEVDDG